VTHDVLMAFGMGKFNASEVVHGECYVFFKWGLDDVQDVLMTTTVFMKR
jgi:hypothetical protein